MYRLNYQDGDSPPQSYTFTSGEVVIGRSPDCQVVLKDFGISRNHAKLIVDDEGVRIQDLKSKNGTQINGVPIVEARLKDGDRILLGKFQISFAKSLEGKVVGLLPNWRPSAVEILRAIGNLLEERCAVKALVMEQPVRELPIRTGKLLDTMRDQLDGLARRVDVVITATGD